MPEPIHYTPEFENKVRTALAVPEPDPAFIYSLREQFLSRSSTKETNMKLKQTGFFPRFAWGFALLVVLALTVTALSSPTVVNAMRRLLGYFPGVGVVEQSAPLRVLVEPVTQTREGITLTVEQAVATADKTVITFHYVKDPSFVERSAPEVLAPKKPALRLPDGSELVLISAQQGNLPEGYRYEFGPLPQGVDHVVLSLPYILEKGKAGPENWEIPIDFRVSTDEGFPVIEVVPTATVATLAPANTSEDTLLTPASSNPDLTRGISFTLDKVVTLPDGYRFLGNTRWNITVPEGSIYHAYPPSITITDANGQTIPAEKMQPEENSWLDTTRNFAYQIDGKELHWPVTLKADTMRASISYNISSSLPLAFQFDPGPNPQPGQTWTLDQNIVVDQYRLHISSARMVVDPDSGNYSYEFTMDSPDGIVEAFLVDLDHLDETMSSEPGDWEPGPFIAKLEYIGTPTTAGAPVRVAVDSLRFVFHGLWQVSWSAPGQ
ncbi:MAG: hypothetical protein AB1649_22720 [Chloroflexota bacterium]